MSDRTEPNAGTPINAAVIEAIAQRVTELISTELGLASRMLSPSEVAAQLGVSRTWVYEHADDLGVVRLGKGPRARLRFDPKRVTRAVTPSAAETGSRPQRTDRQRAADLLPIYGRGQPAHSSD